MLGGSTERKKTLEGGQMGRRVEEMKRLGQREKQLEEKKMGSRKERERGGQKGMEEKR